MERMDWHEYEPNDEELGNAWKIVFLGLIIFIVCEAFVVMLSLWWLVGVAIGFALMLYGLFYTYKS